MTRSFFRRMLPDGVGLLLGGSSRSCHPADSRNDDEADAVGSNGVLLEPRLLLWPDEWSEATITDKGKREE